jgi:hypothetical protein
MLLAALACGSDPADVTVQLAEFEDSGQSGTATLIPMKAQTQIVLKIEPGPPEDDPQPVHVHFGNCGINLGEVRFLLNDVVAGKSTTIVDASVTTLSDGSHNINLHKSHPEIRIYTACGEIPSP